MRATRSSSLLAVLALAAACGPSGCARSALPEEHRYFLPVLPRGGAPFSEEAPALGIGPLRGEGLARGTLIWIRISEFEVEPWKNHQWALPAPEVAGEALVRWARSSGRFREAVLGEAAGAGPVWHLDGTLEALEQEEGPDGWAGRVRLRLTLEESGKGRRTLLWRGILDERVPAGARHPAAVVQALGEAVARGLERAAAAWPFPRSGSQDSMEAGGKASGSNPVQAPLPVPAGPDHEGNP